MAAIVVSVACSGAACADMTSSDANSRHDPALDRAAAGADRVLDATKETGGGVMEATAEAGRATADKTTEIAGEVVEKSTAVAGAVAEKSRAIAGAVAEKSKAMAAGAAAGSTNAWIETNVKSKFADDAAFEGSEIDVDVQDHVLTLSGTVKSEAARLRAATIAAGTEGVTRVVNTIVVK